MSILFAIVLTIFIWLLIGYVIAFLFFKYVIKELTLNQAIDLRPAIFGIFNLIILPIIFWDELKDLISEKYNIDWDKNIFENDEEPK